MGQQIVFGVNEIAVDGITMPELTEWDGKPRELVVWRNAGSPVIRKCIYHDMRGGKHFWYAVATGNVNAEIWDHAAEVPTLNNIDLASWIKSLSSDFEYLDGSFRAGLVVKLLGEMYNCVGSTADAKPSAPCGLAKETSKDDSLEIKSMAEAVVGELYWVYSADEKELCECLEYDGVKCLRSCDRPGFINLYKIDASSKVVKYTGDVFKENCYFKCYAGRGCVDDPIYVIGVNKVMARDNNGGLYNCGMFSEITLIAPCL